MCQNKEFINIKSYSLISKLNKTFAQPIQKFSAKLNKVAYIFIELAQLKFKLYATLIPTEVNQKIK